MAYRDTGSAHTVTHSSGNVTTIPDFNGTLPTSGGSTNASDLTSGVVAHERGGLEADVSAYSGLVKISGGTTSAVSLGSGVETFLGTPSSANLASAVTGETGSGALVFGTSPTIATPTISSPALSGTSTYTNGVLTIVSQTGAVASSSATTALITGLSYTMTDETTATFDFSVTMARRTNVTKAGSYKGTVTYRRTSAGAPTIVGSAVYADPQETTAGDDVAFAVNGNAIEVRYTSADADGRNWAGELRVQVVTNA